MRLKLHPESRCDAVTSIDAEAVRTGGGLALKFVLSGDLNKLALPAKTLPARMDDLWQHTCFEAFVRMDGDGYYEFNAAPSTQWNTYHFDGYRAGMSTAYEIALPDFETKQSANRFEISTTLALPHRPLPWRVGLSAVIEEANGAKSYWALAHAPGKPDFHHADAFALELAEPS
jgi:hypothetical protein